MPILVNFNCKSNLKFINKYWLYVNYILNKSKLLKLIKLKPIMYKI
jgi:hypothetical protein